MRKVVAALVSIMGAFMILRPGSESFQVAGLYALWAAICMGTEIVIVKRLTDKEPVVRILLINNFFGALIALTVAIFVWTSPSPMQIGLMALLGNLMSANRRLLEELLTRVRRLDAALARQQGDAEGIESTEASPWTPGESSEPEPESEPASAEPPA